MLVQYSHFHFSTALFRKEGVSSGEAIHVGNQLSSESIGYLSKHNHRLANITPIYTIQMKTMWVSVIVSFRVYVQIYYMGFMVPFQVKHTNIKLLVTPINYRNVYIIIKNF